MLAVFLRYSRTDYYLSAREPAVLFNDFWPPPVAPLDLVDFSLRFDAGFAVLAGALLTWLRFLVEPLAVMAYLPPANLPDSFERDSYIKRFWTGPRAVTISPVRDDGSIVVWYYE